MSCIFNFKLIDDFNRIIDIQKDYHILVSSFRISSPTVAIQTEKIPGHYGFLEVGERTLENRKINVHLQIEAVDEQDFDLLRDELYALFNPLKDFWLIRDIQPGKRYRVRVANELTMLYEEGFLTDGTLDIEFDMLFPLAESIGTTLDKLEFDVNKWQFGQGLTFEDKAYVHSTNRFKIYNAGDVAIDPRKLPLQIIYRGASNGLTIKNITNQTEWRYNGSSAANDTIKLAGVYSYKNDVNIFGDTSHQLITLEKGWNEIELIGNNGTFLVSFDYRFYFL